MIHSSQRLFACLLGLSTLSHLPAALGASTTDGGRLKALMPPTQDEPRSQREDANLLHNGPTDKHFNRIRSMTFTGLVIAGESGKPKEDPTSGQPVTENDDC